MLTKYLEKPNNTNKNITAANFTLNKYIMYTEYLLFNKFTFIS